jgi:hypothetical protein
MVGSMSDIPRWRASSPLWGALLLSAGAWSAHLIASYFLVEASCQQVTRAGSATVPGVWIALIVITAVAATAALLGAGFAWGRRRALQGRGPGLERAGGLSLVMILLSLFFALVILLELAPILMLACGAS